jgi:phosphatidate phosphatase PAH1
MRCLNEETVILGSSTIPSFLAKSAKYATLKFAGVKFSSFSETERTISEATNKIKEFQWKCLHNINYTEHRLKKINLSNGRCHLCQIRDNDETMQHLFFKCPSVNKIIKEIEAIFNRSGLGFIFCLKIP